MHSNNGETVEGSVFHFRQKDNIVTWNYYSINVKLGHLIALVDEEDNLDMRYHQLNTRGELMTGKCDSRPQLLSNGKLRLHETWEWTSGDFCSGKSIIEEV